MNKKESAKLLVFLRELDAGIVPYELYMQSKAPFDHFTEEEARVSKRKFRKLKRKIEKNLKRETTNNQARKYIFWSLYNEVQNIQM